MQDNMVVSLAETAVALWRVEREALEAPQRGALEIKEVGRFSDSADQLPRRWPMAGAGTRQPTMANRAENGATLRAGRSVTGQVTVRLRMANAQRVVGWRVLCRHSRAGPVV